MYETRTDNNVLGYFVTLTDYETKRMGVYYFGPHGFVAMIPVEEGKTNIVGHGLSTDVTQSPEQIARLIATK